MPPRIRVARTTKNLKENIGDIQKAKLKSAGKFIKPARKALADKTNSASDDNTTDETPKVLSKKTDNHVMESIENDADDPPRRSRRVLKRCIDNASNKNKANIVTPVSNSHKKAYTPDKTDPTTISPFKTPQKADTSSVASRPRRIGRLPSRFEDFSISPGKFVPVQPSDASTPIQKRPKESKISEKKKTSKFINSPIKIATSRKPPVKNVPKKKSPTKVVTSRRSPVKIGSIKHNSPFKNFSFRVLEDKPSNDGDVYEFTYDPKEEPEPQKKRRKRVVKKKPIKPKEVVLTSNYDENMSKALTALKQAMAMKPVQKIHEKKVQQNVLTSKNSELVTANNSTNVSSSNLPQTNSAIQVCCPSSKMFVTTVNNNVIEKPSTYLQPMSVNNASIQIEDIAADFEVTPAHEFNYSPVNSPNRSNSPLLQPNIVPINKSNHNLSNDPLKLRDDLSFFDDNPVASSSMNASTRHPLASPWRTEFGNLPLKWHVNSYVKANMTPAVECSFVNFEDGKQKHVYTNLVPESAEELPQVVENSTANMKQTSIISFMKEVAEKSAAKKKRDGSETIKRGYVGIDDTNILIKNKENKTSKALTPRKNSDMSNNKNSSSDKDTSNETENSRENLKRKKDEADKVQAKPPQKEIDDNLTFFGFDDTEEIDQENVSPKKVKSKERKLRSRKRNALKEINEKVARPTTAVILIAAKSKSPSTAAEILFEELKSGADSQVLPEENPVGSVPALNENELVVQNEEEDSQSVHLFEDIEVVHHLKPSRKSYGKAKKVTFRQGSSSGSDSQTTVVQPEGQESSEDDLEDLNYEVPAIKKKKNRKKKTKATKKQKLFKKEEAEADAWAADFNSMCQGVENFPLVVE